jgi:hypothetical protein
MKMSYLAVLISILSAIGYAQAQTSTTSREEDRAVARACKADAERVCSGKTGDAAKQCLQSNSQKLSSDCKNAMSKVPQTR